VVPTPAFPAPTEPGVVMGTVGYLSPEQVRGAPVDHRSDVFSFGALLYELLTGHRAFQRESTVETMGAILKEEPPELSQCWVPRSNDSYATVLRRDRRRASSRCAISLSIWSRSPSRRLPRRFPSTAIPG
jgi:serine/threonine protein kinase